jgi:hypothetical protein
MPVRTRDIAFTLADAVAEAYRQGKLNLTRSGLTQLCDLIRMLFPQHGPFRALRKQALQLASVASQGGCAQNNLTYRPPKQN